MAKLIKSEKIYSGKVIDVYLEEVENQGMNLFREVVRHNGGSAVLAKLNGRFAFVKQYRHPLGCEFFEIPAGTRDGDEKGDQTACRELREECGLKPINLEFICDYVVSPGYTNEVLHLYYANEFEMSSQSFDEDEQLTVEWLPVNQAIDWALSGKITDGKTLVALLWYATKYGKN